jgi:hypothetical protein
MDNQTFELLMNRLDKVDEKHRDIENKIDELLFFKWKLMGVATALGFAGSFAMNIIMKVF